MAKPKKQAEVEKPKTVPVGRLFKELKPPPVPNERDMKIWRRVAVDREPQAKIVAEMGLSRSRISRIVNRVARHVAMNQPFVGKEWSPDQQQAYANQIAQLELEKLQDQMAEGYTLSRQERADKRANAKYTFDEKGNPGTPQEGSTSSVTRALPQGDIRFLKGQLAIVEAKRRIGMAVALIPRSNQALWPEFGLETWTREERIGLFQRMLRNWYNAQKIKEAKKTGETPPVWPEDEYVDIEGEGPPEHWPAQNACYAKRVAEGAHGDAPLGAGETATGVAVGQASAAAMAAEEIRNPPWVLASGPDDDPLNPKPKEEPEPYVSPNACCDGYREQLAQKGRQQDFEVRRRDIPQEKYTSSVNYACEAPKYSQSMATSREESGDGGEEEVTNDEAQMTPGERRAPASG